MRGCTRPPTASTRRRSTGDRVDDTVLAPGWTSYQHRLRYHAYDVTRPDPVGAERRRGAAGQRLVPRPARLHQRSGPVRAPPRPARASSRSPPPTAPSTSWPPTTPGAPGRARSSRTTCMTASRPTCVCATIGRQTAEVEVVDEDLSQARSPRTVHRSDRPACCRRARCGPRRPARHSSTSVRTQSAGFGSRREACAAGTEIVLRHAEVLENGELATRPLRTAEATDT